MTHKSIAMLLSLLVLVHRPAVTQQTIPLLEYTPPADWYRSAATVPEQYSSNVVNAGFQVYAFRRFDGDLRTLMQQSLLRDWIDPQYQESNIAAQPLWSQDSLAGADAVYNVHFLESVVGIVHEHVRTIVVAHGYAAIMDAQAATQQSWQAAVPQLQQVYHSLSVRRVEAPPSMTSGPGQAGQAIAGLYQGTKLKYVADLTRGPMYSSSVPALHSYLFSADGHVYAFYDAPKQDIRIFDFDRAAREDPVNSGRFSVRGGQLFMQFGGANGEMLVVPVPVNGRLAIQSVVYLKQ